MDSNKPHILVVDDDRRLRSLLKRYLREQGFLVAAAIDAADARTKLKSFAFDLIVMDIMMPGEDGLSLTRHIRKNNNIPILLLTARGTTDDRITGLEGGADDYMPKPFEPRELVLRINSILRRLPKETQKPKGIKLGEWHFDKEKSSLISETDTKTLTENECKLLNILAQNQGKITSRSDLAEITGADENSRSIDVQITRLRRKIEIDPKNPRYLQTIRGQGYKLQPDI